MRNELNDIITNPNLSDEEKGRRIGELNMEELGRNHIENKQNINESQMEAFLSYIKSIHKNSGIPDSLLYDKIREGKYDYILKEDNIDPKTFVEYLDSRKKTNNIEEYIEQLKKEYQLSDYELYDRLKKGMFSKIIEAKIMDAEKAQKLLDHLENKINNEINETEKERQTLVKKFKPKKQKFEKFKNDESELEQDFEKENEEDENEIISTRDGEYLSKKDRFVKWVKNLPLSVKIGACVAGAVALGAAIYHFTQGDAQPLSDIIQNTADTINNTAQHVSEQVSNHGSIDISSLGEAFKEIPVHEDIYQAANLEQPLEADPIWFQKDNPVAGYTATGVEIPYDSMPSDDFVQQMKDGVIKTVKYGMDANGNSSGYVNAEKLLEVAEKTAGGRTLWKIK